MKQVLYTGTPNMFKVVSFTEFLPTELGEVKNFINKCLRKNYRIHMGISMKDNSTIITVNNGQYIARISGCRLYPDERMENFKPDEVPGERLEVLCYEVVDDETYIICTRSFNILDDIVFEEK